MQRRRPVRTEQIIARGRDEDTTSDLDLQAGLWQIREQTRIRIGDAPSKILLEEGNDLFGAEVADSSFAGARDEVFAALGVVEVVEEDVGEGDDVFVEDAPVAVFLAAGAFGALRLGEDAGEAGFVQTSHVFLGVGALDVADEEVDVEGAVVGVPGGVVNGEGYYARCLVLTF